jgi:4-aminobutyrate aminotransferase-like enzyme
MKSAGFARTGTHYWAETQGVIPDIVCMAKESGMASVRRSRDHSDRDRVATTDSLQHFWR